MEFTKVGVIGAGTMGNGIAQVFAQSGFSVTLVDVAPPMLDREAFGERFRFPTRD